MDGVWTITKDHLKILQAAETFIPTHNYVQENMIRNKAKVKVDFSEYMRDLLRLKFIQIYSGTFKLSLSGFDCIAINSLRSIGLEMMGSKIGIGKESDIFLGTFKGNDVAIKVFRLGRTSFNKVEERCLKNEDNWFLANKESARIESEYLQLFSELDVPKYYCSNRHMVVMELLDNYETLFKITVENPDIISQKIFQFLRKMWDMGYAHGDLNEFNIMVCDDQIKVIDFPQCVRTTDERAAFYLKRDIECIHKYFWKKNRFVCDDSLFNDIYKEYSINVDPERHGFELFMNKISQE